MNKFIFIFALSLIFILPVRSFAQQPGQKLYRIYSENFAGLRDIEKSGITVYNSKIDFYLDVFATPAQIKELGREGIEAEFIADSFSELVESRLKTGSYEDYHNHQETIDLLDDFAKAFPGITKLDTIGYSVLGRAICCIKISDNPDRDEDEIPILMVGNHHGNEVLSVEATLYQIDFLLNNYEIDPEVTRWINEMEIWYIPMLNPDGREAIRRTNENGVDLNRNYSFAHTPSANHGMTPFSEPETRAVRDLAAQYPPALSLTYHTSGRLVLLPWTHTDEAAPDSLALTYLGTKIAESITFPVGTSTGHYELRQGGDWYFTEGEYCDYFYATHNTQAFTVEMWTSQTPPADVIPQVIERNLEGMKTMFRQAGKAGVTGRVTDKISGLPVLAKIDFPVFDKQGKLPDRFPDQQYGRYYRYLAPGSYTMEATAPGYRRITREIEISADSLIHLDLSMEPAPELQLRVVELADSPGERISGNGDGLINTGETPGIFITLYNDQLITAEETFLKVSTTSPFMEFLTDSLYFGTIAHFSEKKSQDTILFNLNPDCPDGEILDFIVEISDKEGLGWKEHFSFEAYTPSISLADVIIKDSSGNNNGILDNGETAVVEVIIENQGRQAINDIEVLISSADEYFQILTDQIELSYLDMNQKAVLEFQVSLNQQTPSNYMTYILADLSCREGYEKQIQIQLDNIFGFFDDFEKGENGWTHASYQVSSNHHDDWQLGTPAGKGGDPSSAYSGYNCWGTDMGWDSYMGDSWNGEYQNNVYNYLQSPAINCSGMTGVGLRYMRWLNTRVSDFARIKVNDVIVWQSSVRGHSDLEWTRELIDISDIADGNPDVRITFELETSNSNTLGGWNLDDVLVADKLAQSSTAGPLELNDPSILLDCYPNPFSNSTIVDYRVVLGGQVDIYIMDISGRRIRNLVSCQHLPGNYSALWDAKNNSGRQVAQGLYYITFSTGAYTSTKKLVYLK